LVGANRVTLRDDEPAFTERTVPDITGIELEIKKTWSRLGLGLVYVTVNFALNRGKLSTCSL
jgi:hypothetical protein